MQSHYCLLVLGTVVSWWLFLVSYFVVVCFVFSLFLHNLCWFIFEKANEVHDVKRRGENNIQNKAVQTKLNLYIKKYMKKETLQIF